MNNIITNNYTTNFTSLKVDLSRVTSNKDRWANIAKIAQQRTSKMRGEDEVYVETLGDNINMDFFTSTAAETRLIVGGKATKYLMKCSDNYIASKIIKLLKLTRKKDSTYNALNVFLHKIKNNDEDFAQNITDVVVDHVVDSTKAILKKDPFFIRTEVLI